MSETGTAETGGPSPPGNRRLKLLLVGLSLAVLAFLVTVSIPDVVTNMFGAPVTCSAATGTPAAGHPGRAAAKVTAKLVGGQRQEVDFGRSLTSRIDHLTAVSAARGPGGTRPGQR